MEREKIIKILNIKSIMKTKTIYTPTGEVFENRKAAKEKMGHYNYDRALKAGLFTFITTYDPSDVII